MNGSQKHELERIAREAMRAHGLEPDFSAAAREQIAHVGAPAASSIRDLRSLPWSSIDNDDSRDLDQLEACADDGASPTRVLVAIADVDALVPKDTPVDAHAGANTTSVYTPAVVFPMLPLELSTDRTSLNEGEDRAAIVIEMVVDGTGTLVDSDVYRALVHNHAQLTYSAVAAWLDGSGPALAAFGRVDGLDQQLRLQDEIATRLQAQRDEEGALDFDRSELRPVVDDRGVRELRTETANRAKELIENFMVAANGVTARFLGAKGLSSIRRVVRSPERWPRIVELAARHGGSLPPAPNARALQQFLKTERATAPDDYADLSLSVIKLLGRGEYVAERATESSSHFALAAASYTHSTAPNRRFPDLVTQRLLKAAIAQTRAPYQLTELTRLAEHCTRQEDAANKVERLTKKAAAALFLSDRIGEIFDAVVTGAGPKGTWVRLCKMPIEGRLERGAEGLDVGDRLRARLLSTDPGRGFIDFGRA
ncbi:MAG: ribonuclease II [Acidobacteria bacterium]|nr:MAG: ribonuclease II [Acidobacteriota bacterium]